MRLISWYVALTLAWTPIPTSFQDAISFTLLVLVLVAFPGGLPAFAARFRRRPVRS